MVIKVMVTKVMVTKVMVTKPTVTKVYHVTIATACKPCKYFLYCSFSMIEKALVSETMQNKHHVAVSQNTQWTQLLGYWQRQWLVIARIKFLQPLLPRFQIHSFLTKNEWRLDRNFIGYNTSNTANYHSMYDMNSCTTLQTVPMEIPHAHYFHYLFMQVHEWCMP